MMNNDIYEPAEDSYLLQKEIRKYAEGRILDLGTGSGIQALTSIQSPNVREVVAVDINPRAIEELQKKVKEQKLRKMTVLQSDLFQNVDGQFNLIIFNPPYLPQDKVGGKEIIDPALYGGKKGWEISLRFFKQASQYLLSDGHILFLFSSLTNKQKLENIMKSYLFEFQVIAEEKIPFFETLYIYLIKKSDVLIELEKKNIENISYLSQGKRGNVYCGVFDRSRLIKTHFLKKDIIKVGIKIKREDSKAVDRMQNEAFWLKKLNRYNIGPRLLFSSESKESQSIDIKPKTIPSKENELKEKESKEKELKEKVLTEKELQGQKRSQTEYLIYEFVEGEPILDWLKKAHKSQISRALHEIIHQCFILDTLKVNKDEMHHPLKHIIITPSGHVLIDFERCKETKKPKNVTQFVEFLCRIKEELGQKGILINAENLRKLSKEYKESISERNLKPILDLLN
ncbi:methyltransferase [Candidatus Woesearchaeota archaeon]|nr:methyltransferase [Candidatus Woesearchaeota archaeon]